MKISFKIKQSSRCTNGQSPQVTEYKRTIFCLLRQGLWGDSHDSSINEGSFALNRQTEQVLETTGSHGVVAILRPLPQEEEIYR